MHSVDPHTYSGTDGDFIELFNMHVDTLMYIHRNTLQIAHINVNNTGTHTCMHAHKEIRTPTRLCLNAKLLNGNI